LVAVVVGLLAAGCGGTPITPQLPVSVLAPVPPAPEPAEALVRAASLVSQESGFNFSFELTLSGLPEVNGAPLSVTGSGSTDRGQRSTVHLDLAGVLAMARLAGEGGADIEEIIGDGKIDVIQDGSTVYLRMPFLAKEAGVTTSWVSLTMPNAAAPGNAPLPGLFGQLGGSGSPAAYLAQLKSIDGTVVEDGTGVVRGVTTTRYRGTLDVAKLLGQAAPTPGAAQLDPMMPFFQALKLPYEVWVDAEGLPRRLTATLDLRSFAPAGVAATGEPMPALTFTYDLFDFGAPDPIELPPTGDVTALEPSVLSTLR